MRLTDNFLRDNATVGSGISIDANGIISGNGTELKPVLSPVEQVVVAVVLTAWAGIIGVYFGGRFGGSK